MSIATEITRIKNAIELAYSKCAEKSATIPSNKNVDNLYSTIGSLLTDKYGVTLSCLIGDVNNNGLLSRPNSGSNIIKLEGVVDIANSALFYKFQRTNNLVSFEFTDLVSLSQSSSCEGIFYASTSIESVTFPKLRIIGDSASNTTLNKQFASAFYNCTKLKALTFPSLLEIYCNGTSNTQGTFYNNNMLEKLYFPVLTNINKTSNYTSEVACKNIFSGCTSLTELHFSAGNRTLIEASPGFTTKWGATNATIYFDL